MEKGGLKKESFLFEISTGSEKRLSLKAVVSSGDEEAKSLLCKILGEIPESRKPSGEQWLTYRQLYLEKISHTTLSEKGEDSVREVLNGYWPKVQDFISIVSDAILSKKEEFEKIIQKRK